MKIILFSALLCVALSFTNAANILRIARTEDLIAPIIEEILKVEIASDLKRSEIVVIDEPLLKETIVETIVEPVQSMRIAEELPTLEEKKPEIIETIVAIKEVEAAPSLRNVEPALEVIEKVEIVAIKENIEQPIDSNRAESVPAVEEPTVEIIKDEVIVPVQALRNVEPIVEVIVKEEIIEPVQAFRNVEKEQIVQVPIETLRLIEEEMMKEVEIVAQEALAVKETLPEPIQSATIVEPNVVLIEENTPIVKSIVEAVSFLKTVPETPIVEIIPEVASVPEVPIVENIAPVIEAVKSIPVEIVEAIAPSVKAVPIEENIVKVEAAPAIIETIPAIAVEPLAAVAEEGEASLRQAAEAATTARPGVIQQVQQQVSNFIQNSPIGQVLNRPAATPAISENSVEDEAAATTSRPNFIQQVQQQVQQGIQSIFNPNSNAAASEDSTTAQRPNIIQQVVSGIGNIIRPQANEAGETASNPIQGAIQTIQNFIRPQPSTPTKTESSGDALKPAEDKPALETAPIVEAAPVVEAIVEAAPAAAIKSLVVEQIQAVPETVQKVDEEKTDEKENLVKN